MALDFSTGWALVPKPPGAVSSNDSLGPVERLRLGSIVQVTGAGDDEVGPDFPC